MNELPLFDIDIYGSWENFVEFWELMGKPPIIYNNNKYKTPYDIKKYYIDNIIRFVEDNGDIEYFDKEFSLYDIVTDFDYLPIYDKTDYSISVIEKIYENFCKLFIYTNSETGELIDTMIIEYNKLSLKNLQQIFDLIRD